MENPAFSLLLSNCSCLFLIIPLAIEKWLSDLFLSLAEFANGSSLKNQIIFMRALPA